MQYGAERQVFRMTCALLVSPARARDLAAGPTDLFERNPAYSGPELKRLMVMGASRGIA
jgi:hypothetical protein